MKRKLEDILVKGSDYQSNKLRKRLLKEGIFLRICSKCMGTNWNGKEIPLELNHVNGDNSDHRLENLELLCPNCHAQTDNYRGKNWGNARNKHHYASVAQLVGGN